LRGDKRQVTRNYENGHQDCHSREGGNPDISREICLPLRLGKAEPESKEAGCPIENLGHDKFKNMKNYYVYMLCSKRNGGLYTGVTSDIIKRVYEHKNNLVEGFTRKYNIHRLVWYEMHESAESAINREKQIKKWNRKWKLNLIERDNPQWHDLYEKL